MRTASIEYSTSVGNSLQKKRRRRYWTDSVSLCHQDWVDLCLSAIPVKCILAAGCTSAPRLSALGLESSRAIGLDSSSSLALSQLQPYDLTPAPPVHFHHLFAARLLNRAPRPKPGLAPRLGHCYPTTPGPPSSLTSFSTSSVSIDLGLSQESVQSIGSRPYTPTTTHSLLDPPPPQRQC